MLVADLRAVLRRHAGRRPAALFSGWRPQGSKNKGDMLQPGGRPARVLADAGRWQRLRAGSPTERTWRIVVVPPAATAAARPMRRSCAQDLDKVWQLIGHRADHVHVLWIGALPAGVARATQRSAPGARRMTGLRAGWRAGTKRRAMPICVIDPERFRDPALRAGHRSGLRAHRRVATAEAHLMAMLTPPALYAPFPPHRLAGGRAGRVRDRVRCLRAPVAMRA